MSVCIDFQSQRDKNSPARREPAALEQQACFYF